MLRESGRSTICDLKEQKHRNELETGLGLKEFLAVPEVNSLTSPRPEVTIKTING